LNLGNVQLLFSCCSRTRLAAFLFIMSRGKFPRVNTSGCVLCAPFFESQVPSVYKTSGHNIAPSGTSPLSSVRCHQSPRLSSPKSLVLENVSSSTSAFVKNPSCKEGAASNDATCQSKFLYCTLISLWDTPVSIGTSNLTSESNCEPGDSFNSCSINVQWHQLNSVYVQIKLWTWRFV